jgi:uncharacterized protein YndB with AHSA1/START domain
MCGRSEGLVCLRLSELFTGTAGIARWTADAVDRTPIARLCLSCTSVAAVGRLVVRPGLAVKLGSPLSYAGGLVFAKTATVQISRPPEEVFAFVADARNRPLWDESVATEELTSPEPIGVGSTVRTGLRSMGRDYILTWEITEHEPPSRQTIESTSGPFPTTLAYRLSPRDGGTLVEFSVTGRPTGMLRLLQPLIARNTQKRNLERGFPRLKRLLETGTAA